MGKARQLMLITVYALFSPFAKKKKKVNKLKKNEQICPLIFLKNKSLCYNKTFFLHWQFNNEVYNFEVRVGVCAPYPGTDWSCPRKESVIHHV